VRRFIDGVVVANWARMRGNRSRGQAVVLLEGEKDVRLFSNLLDDGHVRLLPSNGKPNAINALRVLEQDGWKGVLAIVDADFDPIEEITYPLVNLFFTDTHDIETMILN